MSVAPEDAAAILITDARVHGGSVPNDDPDLTPAVQQAAKHYFSDPHHPEPKPQQLFHEVPDPNRKPQHDVRPNPIAEPGYALIPGEYLTRDDFNIWEFVTPPMTKDKARFVLSAEAKASGGFIPRDSIGARAESAAALIEQGRLDEAERKLPGSTKGLQQAGEQRHEE